MNSPKAQKSSPKKRGLGRGLNALFEDEEASEAIRGSAIEHEAIAHKKEEAIATDPESYTPDAAAKYLALINYIPVRHSRVNFSMMRLCGT